MGSGEEELVTSLRDAARDLMANRSIRDMDQTLTQIVAAAVQTVPGAEAGGISITDSGKITSRNPSAPGVTKLDQLQAELHEGPCITAIEEPSDDGVIVADDLAGEDGQRWPNFAPHAVEAGYRAIVSTQLTGGPDMRAALNLYASEPQVFDTDARMTAGLFGVQAALLLYGAEQAGHLQRAVDSRDVIGLAKGILVERFTVDDDEAFQMLVRSSQETNMRLHAVAEWLRDDARQRRANRQPHPDDT